MGVTLAVAGLAVSVVAAGVSAYQASEAAGKQEDQYRAQQQTVADQNALNAMATERQRKQALGKQQALYSASGVQMEGTPNDILSQTSSEYARATYNAQFGANATINNLQAQSDAAGAAANSKITGTLLNTAISGAQVGASIKSPTQTPVITNNSTPGAGFAGVPS